MNPHQEEGSGLHVSRLPHRSSGDCLLRGEETASEYWDNPLQKPFLSLSLPSGICLRQPGKGQTATRALLSLQISQE